MSNLQALNRIVPGLTLCVAISIVGYFLQRLELLTFGRAWIETLVLAILAGAAVRTAWTPGARWKSGIDFSAKLLLEIAVVLLGASVSAATILAAGWPLLISILGIVAGAILLSFAIGRLFGLSRRLAILVAPHSIRLVQPSPVERDALCYHKSIWPWRPPVARRKGGRSDTC